MLPLPMPVPQDRGAHKFPNRQSSSAAYCWKRGREAPSSPERARQEVRRKLEPVKASRFASGGGPAPASRPARPRPHSRKGEGCSSGCAGCAPALTSTSTAARGPGRPAGCSAQGAGRVQVAAVPWGGQGRPGAPSRAEPSRAPIFGCHLQPPARVGFLPLWGRDAWSRPERPGGPGGAGWDKAEWSAGGRGASFDSPPLSLPVHSRRHLHRALNSSAASRPAERCRVASRRSGVAAAIIRLGGLYAAPFYGADFHSTFTSGADSRTLSRRVAAS